MVPPPYASVQSPPLAQPLSSLVVVRPSPRENVRGFKLFDPHRSRPLSRKIARTAKSAKPPHPEIEIVRAQIRRVLRPGLHQVTAVPEIGEIQQLDWGTLETTIERWTRQLFSQFLTEKEKLRMGRIGGSKNSGMICAPLMADSVEQMVKGMHQAKTQIGVDFIGDFQPGRDLKLLLDNKLIPVAVVFGRPRHPTRRRCRPIWPPRHRAPGSRTQEGHPPRTGWAKNPVGRPICLDHERKGKLGRSNSVTSRLLPTTVSSSCWA